MLIQLLAISSGSALGQWPAELRGFSISPFFEEQVVTFRLNEQMTIHIDVAAIDSFDTELPVGLALYALPNGNTIEYTVGKQLQAGDDWHFDIQHIGAQTRFLRQHLADYNLITVYLEAEQLSWPAWKAQYPNYDDIIRNTVEYLLGCFADYDPFVVLTGHSGGGRFIFSYLDGVTEIPAYIKRICFLDSNYGYENSYGDQFMAWLDADPDRYLSVIAYNDSVALNNGEPIVSPTGGTWYRSRMMKWYMDDFYTFTTEEDDEFIRYTALNGRIKIILKKNPEQAILHTVQVELNGFIHTMVTGTADEEDAYTYYGDRAYSDLIQDGVLQRSSYQIPLRSANSPTGSEFMAAVTNLSFSQREDAILQELLTGNVPWFMRGLDTLNTTFQDANGVSHDVSFAVMPDYLSIGTDSNYCRIPMGPITAQRAADFFGMCMPTRKLVDHIYSQADVQLAPVTYMPVGNQNELVPKFVEHNTDIEAQLLAVGAELGQTIGGTKKDVVLSNLIIDPNRPDHVCIYGWHQLNGQPIQPLTNIHVNTYVDYSHGIRLLDRRVTIDGEVQQATAVLQDPILYAILSDESGRMVQPTYIADGSLPARPGSFCIVSNATGEVEIMIQPADNVSQYRLYLSADGLSFDDPLSIPPGNHSIADLSPEEILYFKLEAENETMVSVESEVLAGLPAGPSGEKILVVNGFDRSSSGNSYDFIRHYANALSPLGKLFDSATNDAVIDGLVDLQDYLVVMYMLGEESTADETFSNVEQDIVEEYLRQGGRLFVSGAEVAWDLDYRGTSSDRTFIHNFLKASYSADAPGGVSGTHYTVAGIAGGPLESVGTIHFDNGTHGSFNVRWADALNPVNGSESAARYPNVSNHDIAGIHFTGVFPQGSIAGRLIYLGFPFEAVYPADSRSVLMTAVTEYLCIPVAVEGEPLAVLPDEYELLPNFPNPFNPSTTIRFGLPEAGVVDLTVLDLQGRVIRKLYQQESAAGWHSVTWNGLREDGRPAAAGMYLARLQANQTTRSIKMLYIR
jgi:hypothetical protein